MCKQTVQVHSQLGHVTGNSNANNQGQIMCIGLTQECLSTQNEDSDYRQLSETDQIIHWKNVNTEGN